jgi:hypothetical protein
LLNDDPVSVFAADIVGYICAYADLINARSLALLGDPDASAYELLFCFVSTASTLIGSKWIEKLSEYGIIR